MRDRRHFIKIASATTLALSVVPGVIASARQGVSRVARFSDLSCARFAELMGTRFNVRESSGIVSALVLVAVEDVNPRFEQQNSRSGAQLENFSLLFSAPMDRSLVQGTYEFQHRSLGTFALFIVPMPGDGKRAYYEAVFNRVSRWT